MSIIYTCINYFFSIIYTLLHHNSKTVVIRSYEIIYSSKFFNALLLFFLKCFISNDLTLFYIIRKVSIFLKNLKVMNIELYELVSIIDNKTIILQKWKKERCLICLLYYHYYYYYVNVCQINANVREGTKLANVNTGRFWY